MGGVERLEREVLPRLRSFADVLRARHPALVFETGSTPAGSATAYQGHDVWLTCSFPERTREAEADLTVALCHLDRVARLMADVCWGAPSGFVEDSVDDRWTTNDEWPHADEQGWAGLTSAFPRLEESLARAIERGRPPA